MTFNVAASIKMRKSANKRLKRQGIDLLQCGRIYKDAEIMTESDADVRDLTLQCGRIYKDAEITILATVTNISASLQCGRIYKDAEIKTSKVWTETG